MDPVKRAKKLERQKKRAYASRKQERLRRIAAGLCPRCGKAPPAVEGRRFCQPCLDNGIRYNSDSRHRKGYTR